MLVIGSRIGPSISHTFLKFEGQSLIFFLKNKQEHWQKYLENFIPSHLVFVDFIFRHPVLPSSTKINHVQQD